MPRFVFSERHAITVKASRAAVLHGLKEVRFCDSMLFTLLLTVRCVPISLARRRSPLLGELCKPIFRWAKSGFLILAEKPDEEIVFGIIGQFWKPFGGLSPRIRDVNDFRSFDRPGFAKVATNFLVCDEEPYGVKLVTETRVLPMDRASERKFSGYWKLIRWASSVIRREWLRAIRDSSDSHIPVDFS